MALAAALVAVIVISTVLGTLGLTGVIGANSSRPSSTAPPVSQTDAPLQDQAEPAEPEESEPPPGLAPTGPDIPQFCEYMETSFAGIAEIAAADPVAAATLTEDVKRAQTALRDIRGVAPDDIAEQFETSLAFLDALQGLIQTGESPDGYAEQQTAYGEALRLIEEKKAAVCP
jgi:hypothetical protein